MPPPAQTILYPSYPNPFNPSTLIRYDVGQAGKMALCIYNANGSLVRILAEGYHEAGRYEVSWQGVDAAGRRVASGVYFARLQTADRVQTRKLVLLK